MSEGRTLVLEERYPSPPEAVFEAWRDVDKLRRWFGCGPGQLWEVREWACEPGGRLHVSMTIDAHEVEVEGEFLIVEPGRRLVYRWGADEQVDVRFERDGPGTRLTLTHSAIASDEHRTTLRGGWTFALSRSLAGHLGH